LEPVDRHHRGPRRAHGRGEPAGPWRPLHPAAPDRRRGRRPGRDGAARVGRRECRTGRPTDERPGHRRRAAPAARAERRADGAPAMARLDAAEYDLVLLDLRLPDVDGRAVWEWIGEKHAAHVRRVAFMTGDTMSEDTQRFLESTGRPVLSKPLSIARVRAVL